MSEYYEKACARLDDECKNGKFDKYGNVMKSAVRDALKEFCRQDGEFSQAVVQGGSFSDCMTAVGKKVKNNGISDIDAYATAAFSRSVQAMRTRRRSWGRPYRRLLRRCRGR